jgi:hypothetical protein
VRFWSKVLENEQSLSLYLTLPVSLIEVLRRNLYGAMRAWNTKNAFENGVARFPFARKRKLAGVERNSFEEVQGIDSKTDRSPSELLRNIERRILDI